MTLQTALFAILPVSFACGPSDNTVKSSAGSGFMQSQPYSDVASIPVPPGFKRITTDGKGFGSWLRKLRLRGDNTVYLYNGSVKPNQTAQFAVVDLSVGKRDLQQCADAIMRLRAEFLLANNRYHEIVFYDNARNPYRPTSRSRPAFDTYLDLVFSRCGTISLSSMLTPLKDLNDLQPGDVFIKGGSPGHAMIVVDVAINNEGRKIFMLAQSYMPAQNLHIVLNPLKSAKTPWFELDGTRPLTTPEWTFSINQLKTWP